MAHRGHEDDDDDEENENTSVSSNDNEENADMETREARAMAAQLENMKQIERQQKSLSISMSHGSAHSPRGGSGIPSILPVGTGGMSGPHFPVSPVAIISATSQTNISNINGNISNQNHNINNNNNNSHHTRNNSNPHGMQPRLSNSSVHSQGSRSSPFTTAHNAAQHNQLHQFHPQPHSQIVSQPHGNIYAVTPNSYSMQNNGAPRVFFQSQHSGRIQTQTGARLSDPALAMPSLDENKDTMSSRDDATNDTLSAIWKEIKEIKTKLTDEQEKNEQLRQENRRLREAVRSRNRRIKQLTGKSDYNSNDTINNNNNNTNSNDINGNGLSLTPDPNGYIMSTNGDEATQSAPLIAPYSMNRTLSRNSISSIGSDETLPPENKSVGDWMISLGHSLKAKRCNWF